VTSSFRILGLLALSAATASGALGCDKKTRECNLVIDEVNQVEAKVKHEPAADAKAHAAALRAVADAEEGAARGLEKLHPTQAELGKVAAELKTAFEANARASRDLAELDDRVPEPAAQKALLDRIGAAREAIDGAIERLAQRCSDGAAACTSFAPALKKHPDPEALELDDPVKATAWADAVKAWSAEVAALDVQDKELAAELDKLQKGYKDLALVIVSVTKISADHDKREAARGAQTTSAKAVSTITDDLNKFCQAP
jgi:chromosome segregation ATPase